MGPRQRVAARGRILAFWSSNRGQLTEVGGASKAKQSVSSIDRTWVAIFRCRGANYGQLNQRLPGSLPHRALDLLQGRVLRHRLRRAEATARPTSAERGRGGNVVRVRARPSRAPCVADSGAAGGAAGAGRGWARRLAGAPGSVAGGAAGPLEGPCRLGQAAPGAAFPAAPGRQLRRRTGSKCS